MRIRVAILAQDVFAVVLSGSLWRLARIVIRVREWLLVLEQLNASSKALAFAGANKRLLRSRSRMHTPSREHPVVMDM